MTLGEFRKKTAGMPDHLDLFVGERVTEYQYGLVNSVELKTIGFMEDYLDTQPVAKAEVLVIDEQ